MERGGEKWTRRQAVGGLGALLAVGSLPRRARAAETTEAGEFSFVMANDFHHDGPACDAWFEKLFRQIGAHEGLAFCVGLGDLANAGRPESIAAITRLSQIAGAPFYPMPGNHDNDLDGTTRVFAEVLPGRLNYHWEHDGWQFVAIDSTDGKAWHDANVSPATLAWLDATLPTLDPKKPTLLCTHFPLTPVRNMASLNREDVLARFDAMNLRGVFGGHYHGHLLGRRGSCQIVGNVCCARVVGNLDGSKEKGYWLCTARSDGTVARRFVEFAG